MSIRVRDATPESGGVVAPDDVMQSLAVLVDELNGGLDANNLPEEGIEYGMIALGAFTIINADAQTGAVAFGATTTEWVSENSSGTGINTLQITCNTDALLEVEWSGTWTRSTFGDNDALAIRILVDGSEACRLMRSSGLREHDSTYICGAVPVTAGTHTVAVECRQWAVGGGTIGRNDTFNERELVAIAHKR